MSGNSNSGRKALPTAHHELMHSGVDRQRQHEPARINPGDEVLPPGWLTGEALEYWKWKLPMLQRIGVISATELVTFAMMCRKYGDWRKAVQKCDESGTYQTVDGKFGSKQEMAPWARHEKDLYDQYFRSSREFGLTPSSRAGVHTIGSAKQKPEEDKIT